MNPIEFEGQTGLLAPPPSMAPGTCGALPFIAYPNGAMSSFWKPSAADLEALRNGASLRLDVFCGGHHPPVALNVERVKELP